MRGKFELWVIIFLQVVSLEAQQPKPDLMEIIVVMGMLVMCKKTLLWWKEEQKDGYKYDQHHHHLRHARRGLCDERRRQG